MNNFYCCWELIDSGSISHNYNVMKTLPADGAKQAEFGAMFIADLEKPECSFNFQADNIGKEALSAVKQAAMGRNVIVTVEDKAGQSYTGRISSLSWEAVPGTEFYKASMQLLNCSGEGDLGEDFTYADFTGFNDASDGGRTGLSKIEEAVRVLEGAGAERV